MNTSNMDVERISDMLKRYNELSDEDAGDLYDALDQLFNEIRSKYLDVLWNRDKDPELFDKLVDLTITMLRKHERDLQEDLILIALLDLFATDLHDKIFGVTGETEGT